MEINVKVPSFRGPRPIKRKVLKHTWAPSIDASTLESVSGTLEVVQDGINVLQDATVSISSLLDAVASLVVSAPNPWDIAIRALEEVLESLETGMSILVHMPERRKSLNPRQAALALRESYYDLGDTERPYSSLPAYNLILVMVASSPDFYEMYNEMVELLELIRRGPSRRNVRRVTRTRTLTSSPSRKPDWDTVKFSDIPEVAKLRASLTGLIETLEKSDKNGIIQAQATAYNEYFQRILARINVILEAISDIVAIFQKLSIPGKLLVLYGQGTTADVDYSIAKAFSAEDYPFTGQETCAIVAIHVKASSPLPLQTISGLIGVGREFIDGT